MESVQSVLRKETSRISSVDMVVPIQSNFQSVLIKTLCLNWAELRNVTQDGLMVQQFSSAFNVTSGYLLFLRSKGINITTV